MFLLDAEGNLILHQNISNGIPDDLNALIISLALGDDKHLLYPEEISLHQNYPNPFNPVTTIHYDLSYSALVSIDIYDMNGELVAELLKDYQNAGHHFIYWNGTNNHGQLVSAGIYLYSINAAGLFETRKMTLLK
tara:strand:+ start:406 stop:810 length:405 start_codon:yes stop_codon:yes gene_type:complete